MSDVFERHEALIKKVKALENEKILVDEKREKP